MYYVLYSRVIHNQFCLNKILYAALTSPTVCSHWVSSVSSLWYMVPVTLLTLAWNCPRFLELRTCYDTLQLDTDNTTLTLPRVCISHLRMDESYSRSQKMIFGCFFADSAAEKSAFQLLHKLPFFASLKLKRRITNILQECPCHHLLFCISVHKRWYLLKFKRCASKNC